MNTLTLDAAIGSNQYKMKHKSKNRFETFLFKTLLVLIPLTALTILWSLAVHFSANYIYQTFSEPFLANSGSTFIPTHNQQLTIKPLHIEYTVLKVPTASKTAAKK